MLLLASLCVTVYNIWDERRAADSAQNLVCRIQEMTVQTEASAQAPAADLPSDEEMPSLEVEGNQYIGILELPSLDLVLPVMSDWSYSKLKLSPCRFFGSAYQDNLIIAAHNYPMHFGSLKNMSVGDEILFTDMDGRLFSYTVSEFQLLDSMEIDELNAGEWDLTLFTCTVGGQKRVTVRCERLETVGAVEK